MGEAGGAVGAFAFHRREVDVTALGLADESVFQSVLRVTSCKDRLVNHRILLARDTRLRVLECPHRQRQRPGVATHVGRISRDHTVELIGIPGSLQQALASSTRTSAPVAVARLTRVQALHQRLRLDGRVMLGAIRKINEFLGMADDERSPLALMTIVAGNCRVTAPQAVSECAVTDGPSPAAAANREQLAIPT